MRPIPINSAEAVFEVFFDEHLSELASWTIEAPGAVAGPCTQGWAFVTFA